MADNSSNTVTGSDFAAFEDGVYTYSKRGPKRKSESRGDPLKDTLETLYSEHRYIASLLDTLEQQAERLTPGKIPDYNLLLEILDYLIHYPDQYHHPREDLLFAHMLERDSKFQAKLDRLLREHETLHHYNTELFKELTRIADGRPADQAELRSSIERFIAGYRQHIDYESKEIFPRAKGTLSAADVKKLEARTRYRDDPLFGADVQQQYRRVGRQVQARVGIASQQLIATEMSGIESLIENLTGAVDTASKLRTAAQEQRREAWQEQLNTIKDHARAGESPNILLLPLALARIHRRQVKEGVQELREILGRRGQTGGDAQSPRSKKGK
jgi:hemerythrin-like domain-containing protein